MNKSRFLERMAVTAGFAILITSPGISQPQHPLIASTSTRTQGNSVDTAPTGQSGTQLTTAPTPRMTQQTAAQKTSERNLIEIENYVMSLPLSDDQRTQISRINQGIKTRMDLVVKDDNETTDQKEAMIEGLQRMRLRQIFIVLTHEQRLELRKKLVVQPSVVSGQDTMHKEAQPK